MRLRLVAATGLLGTFGLESALAFDDPGHGSAVAELDYKDFLSRLRSELMPETYFEIGTSKGESLALANCFSVAVDPEGPTATGTGHTGRRSFLPGL